MRPRYRIYVLGALPSDLEGRLAAIHAAAIIKAKSEVSAPAANGCPASAPPVPLPKRRNEKVLSHKMHDQG